jgi:hypothetical protein
MDIVDGGYRKQIGGRCQYRGVLGKTFVVATMRGGLEGSAVLERAIEEDGGGREVPEEEVGGPFRRVVEWGSEKKRWGGIEGNKISWVIGRVVKSAGVGRGYV